MRQTSAGATTRQTSAGATTRLLLPHALCIPPHGSQIRPGASSSPLSHDIGANISNDSSGPRCSRSRAVPSPHSPSLLDNHESTGASNDDPQQQQQGDDSSSRSVTEEERGSDDDATEQDSSGALGDEDLGSDDSHEPEPYAWFPLGGCPRRGSENQALWLACSDDILLGRADNGQ